MEYFWILHLVFHSEEGTKWLITVELSIFKSLWYEADQSPGIQSVSAVEIICSMGWKISKRLTELPAVNRSFSNQLPIRRSKQPARWIAMAQTLHSSDAIPAWTCFPAFFRSARIIPRRGICLFSVSVYALYPRWGWIKSTEEHLVRARSPGIFSNRRGFG